jgi:integrase
MKLAWATAARVGDTLQIEKRDITLLKRDDGNWATQVFFRRGKTVATSGPYTVNTLLSADDAASLQRVMAMNAKKFMWHAESKEQRQQYARRLTESLKAVRPDLALHAIRRGALQTMAQAGVRMDDIRLFSRHADIRTLRRYLQYGKVKSEETKRGTTAAETLL